MGFNYDPRYNIAYIRFKPKTSEVMSIKISDELIVDVSTDGTVYGMELLNANEQLLEGDDGKFLFYNEKDGTEIDVPLPSHNSIIKRFINRYKGHLSHLWYEEFFSWLFRSFLGPVGIILCPGRYRLLFAALKSSCACHAAVSFFPIPGLARGGGQIVS